MGMNDPHILRDPLEFMFALHSMTNAEYNSWRSGISYTERFVEGLDYEEFNLTRLMPFFTVQVYVQTFVLLLSLLSWFVRTTNAGNCNRGDLLQVSPLILHISFGWSMPMVRMALLGSVSCPTTLMSWAILSLPTLA